MSLTPDARIAGNIYSLPGDIVSFAVGAAVTMGQPVKITVDMTVSPATAVTDKIIGVAVTNQATVGKQVSVLMGCPIVYMTASAAITVGLHVAATTGGQIVSVSAGTLAYLIGIAVEGAAAASAVIRVAVMQMIMPVS
jgi:hypothetical protein